MPYAWEGNEMADWSALEEKLGWTFRDRALLRLALTHPSAGRRHNQRLEFLGDAVLEMCVSEQIYFRHPEMQEGAMTQLRQKLVREERLAEAAGRIGLGKYLAMDRGCEATGGRENPSVLCDAFEAVLAAVYLDGGAEAARGMVLRWIGDCSETGETDFKSELQQLTQAKGHPVPVYQTVSQSGPPHDPTFLSAVLLEGKELARGEGKSKKRAEQEAARAAVQILERSGE